MAQLAAPPSEIRLDLAILREDRKIAALTVKEFHDFEISYEQEQELNEVICDLHEHKELVGRVLNGELYPPFPV